MGAADSAVNRKSMRTRLRLSSTLCAGPERFEHARHHSAESPDQPNVVALHFAGVACGIGLPEARSYLRLQPTIAREPRPQRRPPFILRQLEKTVLTLWK